MRRLASLLLCSIVLLSGCAYVANQEQESPYRLYYEAADLSAMQGGDVLSSEPLRVTLSDELSVEKQAWALLEALLQGPASENLRSPIPAGTQLLSCVLEGSRACVDLTSAYGALSGVDLTIADYCITMTLSQLPQISTVCVTVRGRELAYRDKQTFQTEDVLMTTTEDVVGTVDASLYFINSSGNMVPERCVLELYEGDTQVSVLLEKLLAGPERKEMVSALPENFSILSAWQEEDVCYVNLPSAALEDLPEASVLQVGLRAVALSLCSLEHVESVQFLVDGELAREYGGVGVSNAFRGS